MNLLKILAAKLISFRVEILYLLERKKVAVLKPRIAINYRLGALEDLKDLNFSEFDYDEMAIAYSTRRLSAGDMFFLGEINGRIIFYCWVCFGELQIDMDKFWPAPENMAFVYKGFTHQDYRGNNILPGCYHHIVNLADARGIRYFTTCVNETNLSSHRSNQKIGYQESGRIYSWQLKGHRYNRPDARAASFMDSLF